MEFAETTSFLLEIELHICLDIDDTITYAPDFFRRLQSAFSDSRYTIVTFRSDFDEAESYLADQKIRYDQLIVSTDPVDGKTASQSLSDWKAGLVNRLKPDIFFEDMPEVVGKISKSTIVFMPCDEVIREWIRQHS